MRTSHVIAVLSLAGAAAAACADGSPTVPEAVSDRLAALDSGAHLDEAPLPPIFIESLTGRHEFTDQVAAQIRVKPAGRAQEVVNLHDASNLAVLRITVQPGARFPWHAHPGPVMVAVTKGEIVYVHADDCVERNYGEGSAFVDPGFDDVHLAFNSTGGETVLVATFLGVPDAGPLTIPVGSAEQAALDAKCGAPGS
jgi:quercetin dioxygenase-like cupin family protein